jgi:ABC-2 type transport system ATP-binding protein
MSTIQISNVSKAFGKTAALNNVTLIFEADKIYGLLGRNGAGKTTLINIITNKIFADRRAQIND